MIWVDWCFLVVLAVSMVIGIWRGFTREVFGLATWVLAIVAALLLGPATAGYLESYLSMPSVRLAVGYGLVFFAGLVMGSLITGLISTLVRKSPLSGVDRAIGGGFGLIRGVLIGVILVWLVGFTPARQDPWWHDSFFIGKLQWLADGLVQFAPDEWRQRLRQAGAISSA